MYIWSPHIHICQLVNKYTYLNYSYCSNIHISCENRSALDPFRLHGFSHVGIRAITNLPNNHATCRQHHNPASPQPLPTDFCRWLIHNSFHLPPDSCRSPRLHPFVVRLLIYQLWQVLAIGGRRRGTGKLVGLQVRYQLWYCRYSQSAGEGVGPGSWQVCRYDTSYGRYSQLVGEGLGPGSWQVCSSYGRQHVNMYICLTNVHICQALFAEENIDIAHRELDKICIFVNELTNMYMW